MKEKRERGGFICFYSPFCYFRTPIDKLHIFLFQDTNTTQDILVRHLLIYKTPVDRKKNFYHKNFVDPSCQDELGLVSFWQSSMSFNAKSMLMLISNDSCCSQGKENKNISTFNMASREIS